MTADASGVRQPQTEGWTSRSRDNISVHAAPGSYSERALDRELEEAVRVLEELIELLDPPSDRAAEKIDIHLVDTPAVGAAQAEGWGSPLPIPPGAVVEYVDPEGSSEPLTWPLTRFLVGRWYGEHAAGSGMVVEGLAGVVADRVGSGPTVSESDRVAYELLQGGPPPEVAGDEVEPPPSAGAFGITERHIVATSFVAFLLRAHGEEAVRTFLRSWDPERRDEAALATFNEPLPALEETWVEGLAPTASAENVFRRLGAQLVPLLRANWVRELELTAYMLFDAGFSLAIPVLTGLFVNELTQGNEGAILPFMLLLTGSFLLLTPIGLRREYASTALSQRMLLQLQHQIFSRLLRLPHSFHSRANVGDLMARMTVDVERVRGAIEAVLHQALYVLIKGVGAAIVLFFIDPLLALLTIATVPLSWIGYLVMRSRVEEASARAQGMYGELGTATHESLSAHAIIKAFGLEERTLSEYRARMRNFFRSVRRVVLLGSTLDATSSMAVTVSQLIVLGVGGYRVSQGTLEIGFLLVFLQTLPMFFEASGALSGLRRTVTEASGAMERVIDVLDEPMMVEDKPDAVELPPLSKEIRLEDVTFGYEPGRPILEGVSLAIPSGSDVAFVGRSGCGKTTILNLILRFWDPDKGRVLFDGHDLRDVKVTSLRGQIGLVFQDTFVFDTTLRENVAIARPDATDEEIEAAVRAARLDSYVESLPNGFDTVVGERGVRMSGGQRQRLAIARALVRDPRVLVLDEATSALDPQTEAEVQQTLRELSHGRTTIAITHRLASVSDVDRIFVIDRHRLVEEGTHDELLAREGLYYSLYQEQLTSGGPPERQVDVKSARLRSVPLFAELPPDVLADLAERVRVDHFTSGDTLVCQGDVAEDLYFMISGRAEVVASADGGPPRPLATLNQGDAFGLRTLDANEPSPATVRAVTDVDVYSLPKSAFAALLERHRDLADAVMAATHGSAAPAPP